MHRAWIASLLQRPTHQRPGTRRTRRAARSQSRGFPGAPTRASRAAALSRH